MPFDSEVLENVLANADPDIVEVVPNADSAAEWWVMLYSTRSGDVLSESTYLGYTRIQVANLSGSPGGWNGPLLLGGRLALKSLLPAVFRPANNITLSEDVAGVAMVPSSTRSQSLFWKDFPTPVPITDELSVITVDVYVTVPPATSELYDFVVTAN